MRHRTPNHTYGPLQLTEYEDDDFDRELSALISYANDAAFILLLQRITSLSDEDLAILTNSLRSCGMIADERGNLLPSLFTQIHREAVVSNGSEAQFRRLHEATRFPELELCIHGRYVRCEALEKLAALVREAPAEPASLTRNFLEKRVDTRVHEQLLDACGLIRISLKLQQEKYPGTSEMEWKYFYCDPIDRLEAIGLEGV